MLTLKYNSLKDKSPRHAQEVIVLSLENMWNSFGVKTTLVTVQLEWIEYDSKGYATGISYTYDESTDSEYSIKDTLPSPDSYDLTLELQWVGSSNYLYWIDSDYYTKTILEGL